MVTTDELLNLSTRKYVIWFLPYQDHVERERHVKLLCQNGINAVSAHRMVFKETSTTTYGDPLKNLKNFNFWKEESFNRERENLESRIAGSPVSSNHNIKQELARATNSIEFAFKQDLNLLLKGAPTENYHGMASLIGIIEHMQYIAKDLQNVPSKETYQEEVAGLLFSDLLDEEGNSILHLLIEISKTFIARDFIIMISALNANGNFDPDHMPCQRDTKKGERFKGLAPFTKRINNTFNKKFTPGGIKHAIQDIWLSTFPPIEAEIKAQMNAIVTLIKDTTKVKSK